MIHSTDLLTYDFWTDILSVKYKQDLAIRAYYRHEFSPSCLSNSSQIAEILLSIIGKYKLSDIISLLQDGFTPFHISTNDIPQFSNFDVCYHEVVSCLIESGYSSVNFDKMGFLLRNSPRNTVADKKYGENQAKTASLMGLCEIKKIIGITTSAIGNAFYKLSYEQKQTIKPQLCLYIPMMQNRFVSPIGETYIPQIMSTLAISTQKRRYPNVKKLESIITNALEHELYGS